MSLSRKLYITSFLIISIWIVFGLDLLLPIDFLQFGIKPREIEGLQGILFSPFLHANLTHIISNSIPLFVLTLTLFLFYEKQAIAVWVGIMLMGGSLVWIFAGLFSGPSVHVGASGVIYGLVAFLIVFGIYQKSFQSILISIIVLIAYGSIMFGVLPNRPQISWQGHLYGALSGIYMAYFFRGKKRVSK
jgi:membrane associated rhomboid family serine protease